MAVQWQTIDLPFGGGISTKQDSKQLSAPKLTTAENVQFTETGGIQKRRPFSALGVNVQGGGTIPAIRRLATFDDELIAFTEEGLYSWSSTLSVWVLRDTHLAVKVTEQPAFTTATEQRSADRAEAGGVALYVWTEQTTDVYTAAVDTETGSVLYGPVAWPGDGADANFVRCISNGTSIVVVLGESLTGEIFAVNVDPTDIEGTISSTSTLNSGADATGNFDVAEADGDIFVVWGRTTSTAYGLAKFENDATITRSTHTFTADGVVAIDARGTSPNRKLCVMRAEGTNVDADLFDELTEDVMGTVVGTIAASDNQLTCAWRDTAETGGEFRAYGFWSSGETESSSDFQVVSNYVDDTGATGTAANFVKKVGVASSAFSHSGRVFVWLTFAASSSAGGLANPLGLRAQLQNTYFLYRDDGLLVSKAVGQRGGGFSSINNHLPTVQNTSGSTFKWLGIERRVIPIGDPDGIQLQTAYAARSPVDITFEFDSDEARRSAQLGETLYVAGGQALQYDGQGLVELGFHTYPWYFDLAEVSPGGEAIPADQTHTFKTTWAWENAKGALDRSSVAGAGQGSTSATAKWQLDIRPLSVTLKKPTTRAECAVEVWRTKTDPIPESPFYLTTSKDPTVTTGDNRFLANDGTLAVLSAFLDNLEDADLEKRQSNPENGGVLENLVPPSSSVVFANDERVFLAGIANDKDLIAYSKLRSPGEVVSFHDALSIPIPQPGGRITAIAEFFGSLVVFKESAVYSVPGAGFSNVGTGQNYGPTQLVASDTGAISQESVAITPMGIVFKSSKGWYLFDRGFTVRYIGGDVDAYDAEQVVSVVVLEDKHEVRAMTNARCLVFDYVASQWAHWTLTDAVDAVMWKGQHVYATATGIFGEDNDFSNPTNYSMVIETAWIKPSGLLQGYSRCRRASLLGERRTDHSLKIEVGKNYEDAYFQTKVWTVPDQNPLQVRHSPSVQKLQSVRFRITDLDPDQVSAPTGESLTLSGIALEVGSKRWINKGLSAALKQ